jgi:hypothetical protein
MKKIILIALLILGLKSTGFTQSTSNITAPVTASLIRGLTIQADGSNTLSFGEIVVTGSSQPRSIPNSNGQRFKVTGQPERNTSITYDETVTLDNNAWVAVNGGTQSTLTFTTTTIDHTGSGTNYVNPVPVISGASVPLPNVSGTGTLYLWVGGAIVVPANHPQGDYIGTFHISVAY